MNNFSDPDRNDALSEVFSPAETRKLQENISALQEMSMPHPSLKVRILERRAARPGRTFSVLYRYAALGCCALALFAIFPRDNTNMRSISEPTQKIEAPDYSLLLDPSFEFELLDDDFVYLEELL